MTWLEHCADCADCYRARQDLAELRAGRRRRKDVTLACPVGLRLMPLADLDLVAEPLTRESGRRFAIDLRDCLVRRAS